MAHFVVDAERSKVSIEAKSNVRPIHASTNGLEGFVDIEFDAAGSVDLSTIPSGQVSLNVDRLHLGHRMDRELQKRMDTQRFPSIDCVFVNVEAALARGTYLVTFDVTWRGITRRQVHDMEVQCSDDRTVLLNGSARFDVRDFGLEPPKLLLFKVEPEVELRLEIIAVSVGG